MVKLPKEDNEKIWILAQNEHKRECETFSVNNDMEGLL